jgi:diacylglycerol kinase (ATP)
MLPLWARIRARCLQEDWPPRPGCKYFLRSNYWREQLQPNVLPLKVAGAMLKTCLILNPKAGSATELPHLKQRIAEQLPGAKIKTTGRSGSAERAARQATAEGFELIVAAGGDGTLNEVVNGISGQLDSVALGLLPLGTGNDFARSAGVPQNVEQALQTLRAAVTRRIDLVRVTTSRERHFLNVSAGGFSGLVDAKLTREIKSSWGPLAYLRSAASAFKDLQAYPTTISLDDQECLSLKVYNIVVANGRYVAGGMPIAPQASIDDGLLDLVILRETSAARLALTAPRVLRGSHLEDETVVYRRAARVCVNPRASMPFNLDGELLSEGAITFQVMPRALQFVMP